MKEELLTSTSEEKEANSVDYEQFYEQYEKLLNTSINDSLADRNTSIQTYTTLPFTTKSNSPAVFAIEQENVEKHC